MLVSGCAIATSEQAICDGTERLRDFHTEALIEDGGSQSVITGSALLDALDRACEV
jgi:hypothetical protein